MGGAVRLVVDVNSDLRRAISVVTREVINSYSTKILENNSDLLDDIQVNPGLYKLAPNLELLATSLDSGKNFRLRISESFSGTKEYSSHTISLIESEYSEQTLKIIFELEGKRNRYSRQRLWKEFPSFVYTVNSSLPFLDNTYPIGLETIALSQNDLPLIKKEIADPKRRRVLLLFVPSNPAYAFSFQKLASYLRDPLSFLFSAYQVDVQNTDTKSFSFPSGSTLKTDTLYLFEPGRSIENTLIQIPMLGDESTEEKFEKKQLDSKIRQLTDKILQITLSTPYPVSIARKLRSLTQIEQDNLLNGKTFSFPQGNLIDSSKDKSVNANPISSLIDQNGLVSFLARMEKKFLSFEDLDDIANSLERIDILGSQIRKQAEELENLQLQVMYLREDLDEEALGRLDEFEQKSKLKAEIRYLRDSLVNTQAAYLAFQPVPEGEFEAIPLSFSEVLDRMNNLPFVTYTGNSDGPEELDQIDTGSSAPRCWEYLEALDDYARAKRNKVFDGNLMSYLKNTPNDFRSFSFHKYAPKESEKTLNQPHLAKIRTFPVPTDVHVSGQVLMESHIKVSRRIRMHFYDDTNSTGMIYLGYIGQHLPLADD